jgi:hypothetical protein
MGTLRLLLRIAWLKLRVDWRGAKVAARVAQVALLGAWRRLWWGG